MIISFITNKAKNTSRDYGIMRTLFGEETNGGTRTRQRIQAKRRNGIGEKKKKKKERGACSL